MIGEWFAHGRRLPTSATGHPADLTVSEAVAAYWRHIETYYVKNGRPTSQQHQIRAALRRLVKRYGHTQVVAFGPLALEALRQGWVDAGLCRNECNRHAAQIVRMFRWLVSKEMVPATVHQALKALAGLRRGRTPARETPPVAPVPMTDVEATLPFLNRRVAAMVKLQLLTACAPPRSA